MNEQLLDWLRHGLEQPTKSRRGLANAIGVDPASVTRMLKGARRLRVEEIEPAARYLGVAPPQAFLPRRPMSAVPFVDLPANLRRSVLERSIDLNIEPEEFLTRAVRAALTILGPRRDRGESDRSS